MMARIAHEARCSTRTVRRWLEDRRGVLPVIAYALERACDALDVSEDERVLHHGRRRCG